MHGCIAWAFASTPINLGLWHLVVSARFHVLLGLLLDWRVRTHFVALNILWKIGPWVFVQTRNINFTEAMLRLIHRLEMLVKVKTWVSIWSLVRLLERSRIFMVLLWRNNSGWVLLGPSLREFLNLEIWVRSQFSFLPNLKMILLHDWTQIWVKLILVTR